MESIHRPSVASLTRISDQFSQMVKSHFHVAEHLRLPGFLVHVPYQIKVVRAVAFNEPVPTLVNANTVIAENNRPLAVCLVDKPTVFMVRPLNKVVRKENRVRLSAVACPARRHLVCVVVASTASDWHQVVNLQ
jgi:hypothetical protein